MYNIILHSKPKTFGNTWEICWEIKFGNINWPEIYQNIYQKMSVYHHNLCYKIITRVIVTNKMLHVMGIRNSPMCVRCKICVDTVEHKFWLCHVVNKFWKDIANYINSFNIITHRITFTPRKVILGVVDNIVLNRIICIGKSVISRYENINVQIFAIKFKIELENERCVAHYRGSMAQFNETWGCFLEGLQKQ